MFYLMWQKKKSLQKEGGRVTGTPGPPLRLRPWGGGKSAGKWGWRWRIARGEKKKLRKKEEVGEKGRARRNMTDKKQWRRRMMLTKRRDIVQLKWSDVYFSWDKKNETVYYHADKYYFIFISISFTTIGNQTNYNLPCGKKKAGNQKAFGWSRGGSVDIDDWLVVGNQKAFGWSRGGSVDIDDWLVVGVGVTPVSRDTRDFDLLSFLTKSNQELKKSTLLARLSTHAPSGLQDSYAACYNE